MLTRKSFVKAGVAGLAALALVGCSDTSDETTDDTTSDEEAEDEDEATSENEASESEDASAEAAELIVFAAASLTESLTEIAELFQAEYPEYTVSHNFDSSGTLKTQIEEGAVCDVFISAGQKQMDQLDIEADSSVNTDGLDYVYTETRFDILQNEVVLVVPDDNPAGIQSFDDMAQALEEGSILMAMGNSDVPVGQYTQLILEYYGLDEDELASSGVLTYGTNVKEVTTQVVEASVDCGVVYKTDAYSAGLTVVDSATADMCGEVVYPAAVIKSTTDYDAAQTYLDFLVTADAAACFEEVGFTPLIEA